MKKKKSVLAILLCACMLIFVGCWDGGKQLSLDGVKVLAKSNDYELADAVGENSVNFYNEFAREVMFGLYNIFENPDIIKDLDFEEQEKFFLNLDTNHGETFENFTGENKYFLFDSLRYTIKSVQTSNAGEFLQTTITLDASKPWNWTIPYDKKGEEIVFMTDNLADNSPNFSNLDSLTFQFDDDFHSTWTEIYGEFVTSTIPSFSEYYYTEDKGTGKNAFWTSPYYQEVFGKGDAADAKNFFQDALEYVTYLFVLGYDYVDYVGPDNTLKNDAKLFDFSVVRDPETDEIIDIKVGGWTDNDEKISVSKGGENSALGIVKKIYSKIGGYVGLTDKEYGPGNNIEQIERFIKDKVIGPDAWSGDKFSVNFDGTTINFNRNYEQVVKNILQFACSHAPIGDTEDGSLSLNSPYLISDIIDFKGGYFEPSTNDNMFGHIDAAEYQSIVFMPSVEDFDLSAQENAKLYLSMLTLYFEYWDGESKDVAEANAKGKNYAPSISIEVGFRYFDHEAGENGEYTATASKLMEIEFGMFPRYGDYGINNSDYEKEWDKRTVSFSDSATGGCVSYGKEVQIKTTFNNPPAIDAFANGKKIDGFEETAAKRIRIGGGTKAKDYYKFNKSQYGNGYFGTLKPEKFAGESGCDFIEVYFNVLKKGGLEGASLDYSFKVCTDFMAIRNTQKA